MVIKNYFFYFVTPSRSFSLFSCIEKNIGKWLETSDLITPLVIAGKALNQFCSEAELFDQMYL